MDNLTEEEAAEKYMQQLRLLPEKERLEAYSELLDANHKIGLIDLRPCEIIRFMEDKNGLVSKNVVRR